MKAHELLSDETKWTKNAIARNHAGESIDSLNPDAVCYCALGAIERTYDIANKPVTKLRQIVCHQMGFKSISEWNDLPCRTFQQVKELFVQLDI